MKARVIYTPSSMDIRSFFTGAISGSFGVLVSHPFDTIKTHIQKHGTYKAGFNIRELYRGMTSPLLGIGLEKAIVFGVQSNVYSKLIDMGCSPLMSNIISGGITGVVSSGIVTPIEKIKIDRQLSTNITGNLWRGYYSTVAREVPGFAVYFGLFNTLYRPDMSVFSTFLLGGITGSVSWAFIYPQDVVKTRVQTTTESTLQAIRIVYSHQGLSGFYRGYWLAVMRAFPLHAGTLTMMSLLAPRN